MFSTCLHCTARFGRNDRFEAFPVGRRLAFDPRRGRLWVVCPACARWNLSPLEERWEGIEAMERAFRDTRLRASTDQVGMARLPDGVVLIRIGDPLRPEMAAWRYGDQLGRRRNRQLLVTGAVVGSAAAIVGGIAAVGMSVGSVAGIYGNRQLWTALIHGRQSKSIGTVTLPDGRLVELQRRHARMSALECSPDRTIRLRLETTTGTFVLQDVDALRAAQRILPAVNRFGGSRTQVQEAVALLERAGSPLRVWERTQDAFGWKPGEQRLAERNRHVGLVWDLTKIEPHPGTLHSLPAPHRLALEMALHEEQERRAMEGELAELTRAWQEAEEIAGIADQLFTPQQVEQRLVALRQQAGTPGSSAPPVPPPPPLPAATA